MRRVGCTSSRQTIMHYILLHFTVTKFVFTNSVLWKKICKNAAFNCQYFSCIQLSIQLYINVDYPGLVVYLNLQTCLFLHKGEQHYLGKKIIWFLIVLNNYINYLTCLDGSNVGGDQGGVLFWMTRGWDVLLRCYCRCEGGCRHLIK